MARRRDWWGRRRAAAERIERITRERDDAIRMANNLRRLKDEEIEFLREQLNIFRDTLHAMQVEKQLQGAIARADLERLTTAKAVKPDV